MDKKKNITIESNTSSNLALVLGLSIPLIVIILVAIFSYLPSKVSSRSDYDFVYYLTDYSKMYSFCNGAEPYYVQNNKLQKNVNCGGCFDDLERYVKEAGKTLTCADKVELLQVSPFTDKEDSGSVIKSGSVGCPSTYSYCVENNNDGRSNHLLIGVIEDAQKCSGPIKSVSYCGYWKTSNDAPKIYKYDSVNNKSSIITFDDAIKLSIDTESLSPDSFSVRRGRNSNYGIFELFGGVNNDYNRVGMISSDGLYTPLNIVLGQNNDFRFIGWVMK